MERLLKASELVPDNEVWVSPSTYARPFTNSDSVEVTKTFAQQLKAAIALVRKQALSHLDTDAQKSKCCDFLLTIEQRAAV